MNSIEVQEMAQSLLSSYGDRAFEISMPDLPSYELMRDTLARLGRESGPDGEFFVIKVFPIPEGEPHFTTIQNAHVH